MADHRGVHGSSRWNPAARVDRASAAASCATDLRATGGRGSIASRSAAMQTLPPGTPRNALQSTVSSSLTDAPPADRSLAVPHQRVRHPAELIGQQLPPGRVRIFGVTRQDQDPPTTACSSSPRTSSPAASPDESGRNPQAAQRRGTRSRTGPARRQWRTGLRSGGCTVRKGCRSGDRQVDGHLEEDRAPACPPPDPASTLRIPLPRGRGKVLRGGLVSGCRVGVDFHVRRHPAGQGAFNVVHSVGDSDQSPVLDSENHRRARDHSRQSASSYSSSTAGLDPKALRPLPIPLVGCTSTSVH